MNTPTPSIRCWGAPPSYSKHLPRNENFGLKLKKIVTEELYHAPGQNLKLRVPLVVNLVWHGAYINP